MVGIKMLGSLRTATVIAFGALAYSSQMSAQILAVSPGTITTIAGVTQSSGNCTTAGTVTYSGPATSSTCSASAPSLYNSNGGPLKVAVDGVGNVYVADFRNGAIRKLVPSSYPFTAATTYTMKTIVGLSATACSGPTVNAAAGIESLSNGDGCAATSGSLSGPYAVALNSAGSLLFIADLNHGSIRAVNVSSTTQTWGTVTLTSGYIYTVAGTGTRTSPADKEDGTTLATSSPMDGPHGLFVDSSNNLWISDYSASTIRKVVPSSGGNFITTVVGGNTTSASPITVGTGQTCASGYNNNAAAFGSHPCGDGYSPSPPTAASSTNLVEFSANETAIVDNAGNVYFSDASDFRIRAFNVGSSAANFYNVPISAGTVGTIVGSGSGGVYDGYPAAYTGPGTPATVGRVDGSVILAFDPAGTLYFADTNGNEIRHVDFGGNLTGFAGHSSVTTNCSGSIDSVGDGCPSTNASLSGPSGVAVDAYGNMILDDSSHYLIREVNAGLTTLPFGSFGIGNTSTAQTVTIYNPSATTVNFTGITIPSNYVSSGGTCTASTSLTAGANCTLILSFAPQTIGPANGTVSISSNATNVIAINLTGTGTQASTSTAESITPNPAGNGQTVTLAATVTGVSAISFASGDTVTFSSPSFSSSYVVPLSASGSGTAIGSTTVGTLSPGSYVVTATFNGDSNYTTSASATTTLVVSTKSMTTTALGVSTSTPTYGSSITLTATVAGSSSPTGSVYFYNGSVYLGSAALSGTMASISTVGYSVGSNALKAVYQGDSSNLLSTSSVVTVTGSMGPSLIFTPSVISTVAGNGTSGYSGDGASALAAQLHGSNGLALDAAGNIYIADTMNHAIRVVNTQGSSVTIAGVTIPAGAIATLAGTGVACSSTTPSVCGDGGASTSAALSSPVYVRLDAAGNIYIADTGDNAIRVINTQSVAIAIAGVMIQPGFIGTVAGTWTACAAPTASPACGDGGAASAATIHSPRGVALDAAGNIYIVDNADYRVRVVNTQSSAITIAGITIQPGNIGTIAGTGSSGYSGDNGAATSAKISSSHGLLADSSGQIYLADDTNQRVRVISSAGIITTFAGTGTQGSNGGGITATTAQLNYPGDVVEDGAGDLYIPVQSNYLGMVNTSGVYNLIAGIGTASTSCSTSSPTQVSNCYAGDGGSALAAQIYNPESLALDAKGNLYFTDVNNNVIRKLTVGIGALPFGNQNINTTSSTLTATVMNGGSQTLSITGVSIPSPFASASGSSLCASATNLAAGANCTVNVTFSPTTLTSSSLSGTLTTNSINAVSGKNLLALTGTGVQTPAALAYSSAPPDSVYAGGNAGTVVVKIVDSLGNTVTGDSTDVVTLTASGPTPVTGSPFSATASSGLATFNLSSSSLPVGGPYTLTAASGALTSISTTIDVVSNINSRGTATGGASTSPIAVTVVFSASGTLGSTLIGSLGTTGTAYSLASGGTCAIGTAYTAGQTCTVMVQLAPTGPNLLTGRLQLYDNSGTPVLLGTGYVYSLRDK